MRSTEKVPGFYDALPRETRFSQLTDPACYHAIPDDWVVGVADVVGSTAHVAAGRYKTVNMVGAAVVSAMMNGTKGQPFPFVFGGDGAGFAVPPTGQSVAETALSAVATWALAEFEMELRIALVPVAAIRASGHDVRVARFQVADQVDYAMFSGGGFLWAEKQMKAGQFLLPNAPEGVVPDLTGLSCRWAHMGSRQGKILSLVVAAEPSAPPNEIAAVYDEVIELTDALDRSGHPAPVAGMEARWPPAGATLEGHAARAGGSFSKARGKALFESLVAWLLIKTGVTVGGFDARRYARVVARNADFRKLDDGLKMTLDCDAQTQNKLEAVLERAAAKGLVYYGIVTQDEAMMTCIVPSIMTDDHLHFIDGASGGYTQAAAQMKASLG